MSCVRILRSLEDCQRKHRNQADLICSSLTAAAGWCIFASICPAEVRAIEDCIGISKSIGGSPVIPKRCQDRAALLEACIETHQALASEKTTRCKGAQPIPKPAPPPAAAASAAAPAAAKLPGPMAPDKPRNRSRNHKHHSSFDIDFNGTTRTVPSSSGSESDSQSNSQCDVTNLSPTSAVRANGALVATDGVGYEPQLKRHKHHSHGVDADKHITPQEWGNMALLVLLYAMQGIPLGLTMGAMPFLLQSKLSMTQMGLFSMASYPYSFKLLWSPIVDSCYSAAFGRRKSWIVPVQLASAALLITGGGWIQQQYELGAVAPLTVLFFFFVLLAATQDIAVDGWALTLLPPRHIEYASTCQTLGMNTGYFTSFTIFLALSNPEFCNKYIRSNQLLAGLFHLEPAGGGLISLKGYVSFWGWTFTIVTLAIALLKQESDHFVDAEEARRKAAKHARKPVTANGAVVNGCKAGDSSSEWQQRRQEIVAAYVQLWDVVCLPAIWGLSFLLLSYRLGMLPAESAAALKLLDKGVAKESLAALVLVQFPVELLSAVIAGRWASSHSPYQPFMAGYFVRLTMSVLLTYLAKEFPAGASLNMENRKWFGSLSAIGLVTSFSSTLMFTALGSFFNRISDPSMGGAYLTLLNTIANMGVILPKTPLFAAMDVLTVSSCRDTAGTAVTGLTCPKKIRELTGSNACTNAGHICSLDHDGFYIVSYTMAAVGLLLGIYFSRLFPKLDKLPLDRWRARHGRAKTT